MKNIKPWLLILALVFGLGYTYWTSVFITYTYYSEDFPFSSCNTVVSLENNQPLPPEDCVPYLARETNGFPFQFKEVTYDLVQEDDQPLTFNPNENIKLPLAAANVLAASAMFYLVSTVGIYVSNYLRGKR